MAKGLDRKQAAADRAYSAARTEWEGALVRWKREASRDTFAEKLKALEKARVEMADLPNEQRRRLASWRQNGRYASGSGISIGFASTGLRHLAKINYPFMSLAEWYNSIRHGTCLA